ncbi:thiol-disulfide oxidoreductase DCC family protein [Streptacidiphilus sp. N1-12]|uniref:Thiol-disulfide oxidoreductase DCC family protein n=2 Tax=Streptacidiphilus alkalitolerans TaxID=3342712 RepID=A0ABV6WCL4_9ACTN
MNTEAAAGADRADRGPSDAPVRRLTVLYDQGCPLCRHVRGWLERQRKLVPLDFVPAGSPQARQCYPALDHDRTLREITVIGDSGQVYEGAAAWVVCLWALHAYRPMSHRFATPSGAQLARGMVLTAAKWRAGSQAPGRPTAPGRAGRTGGSPAEPSAAAGPWSWNGKQWEPSSQRVLPVPTRPPQPAAQGPAPCEGHCSAGGD